MNITKKYFVYIFLFYAVIQIVYVSFVRLPFSSDSLRYYNLAQECIKEGTFYPASHNLYDSYIVSPFYINYTILILRIYNSPTTIYISNICLNLLQFFLIYKIAGKLFETKLYQFLAGVLYVLYLTNLGAIFFNLTEFMFGVFVLTSFYFYLRKRKIDFLLSGIFLALAINIRQMGFALLLSYLTIYLICFVKKKAYHSKMLFILTGFTLTILIVGFLIKLHYGQFIFYSDNGPVNILIGANDDATGTYNDRVFKKGKIGYIEDESALTHVEKEEFWKNQAMCWIKNHPFKWLLLFPNKLAYMFLYDDWSIPALLNTNRWNLYAVGKIILKEKRMSDVFEEESLFFKIAFILLYVIHHVYYFSLLFMMIFQFYYYRKKRMQFWLDKFLEIYLFSLYGIGMTLLAFGSSRFKYPFFVVTLITIVPLLFALLKPSLENK